MKKVGMFLLLFGMATSAHSNHLVGTIHTIHTNLATRLVHVYLVGQPQFDSAGACSSMWTANSLDDQDFKSFVLPLLLTAQTTGKVVSIDVSGCISNFPIIYAVDLVPRE